MEHQEEIRRLFKMYLEGKTNASQNTILFHYLNDNKNAEQELSDLMNDTWEQEPATRDDSVEANEGLEQLWTKIDHKKQKTIQRFQLLKYAASLVMICSAVFVYKANQKKQPESAKSIAFITKTTASGEKVKMLLPDSSVVYLGSRSRISWPEHFEKGKVRNVSLEGEAFFEVKHDAASPFIIRSGKMETQVLGTSFNIYAYPEDKIFTVSVRTGKVGVTEKSAGVRKMLSLLTPGMKIAYNKDNGKFRINVGQFNEADSWTNNRFVFHDENLSSILVKLERYYNVHFEVRSSKLKACRFNATFSNININEVMTQLRIMSSGHIKYKISDDKTTIALWGEACE
ncbi:FecR family protein [Mucilaginibacter lappiensis]|uniref:Ferric-dicitrate binding protein FerR (Iron transport regulator) n=1 Tax=Mucilaginibacter lappiensis TaxID=354630 RepID=A0ABR6PH49_9SPHI|nr:FecR family protein [Mucilaginibacter lappiensis]MBB6108345.1 ferric-dicitrate binding protein FerR (iron transport regulator) [Mucilaginibacter lappiensis]SIQ41423.1 FecR family protein [Mucilaginibacter lappiensis]